MTSFIGNTSTNPTDPVINIGWPDLDLSDVRDVLRVEQDVTNERLRHLVCSAMFKVNDQLTAPTNISNREKHLYKQAVYAKTAASLLSAYRDYDTSAKGNIDADNIEATINEYKRDSAVAIRALLGKSSSCVELI